MSPRAASVSAFARSALIGACILHTTPASADVSSWLAVGGGYGLKRSEATDSFQRATALSLSLGVGSDPHKAVVLGGILRSTTHFSLGTDLGIAARFATGGFARGQWGLALDCGPAWRIYRTATNFGLWPLQAMLTIGAPWGIQAGIGGDILSLSGDPPGAPIPLGLVGVLEVDLLRLTVMRQGATDRWWENPAPAGGKLAAWQ